MQEADGRHALLALFAERRSTYLYGVEELRSRSERRTTVTASKNGFFRSALNAFVEARQREAERYVNGVLLSLDDETLKSHGYNRAELSQARDVRTASRSDRLSASGAASPSRRATACGRAGSFCPT